MSVLPISGTTRIQPSSVSGQQGSLGEARAKLRKAVPAGQWDAVMAEVTRVQQSMQATPLQAYETVLAKLAAGWTPSA